MSYLHEPVLEAFPPFELIQNTFGFLPNFFRAQTLRPDLIEAELHLIGSILVTPGALTRQQKEYIFLVCSGANLSTYCVTDHCEIVRMLGLQGPEPEQIAIDHTATNLPEVMKALLNFAVQLNSQPTKLNPRDIEELRAHGYTDQHILETVVMVGMAKFANFVSFGLGTEPDFDSSKIALQPAPSKKAHLLDTNDRPTDKGLLLDLKADPDAESVAKVRSGDLNAFEELINRHSRRVYRTLVGILGNPDDARDAMQDTFLKAFQHLGEFEQRAKFSTWLVSIATNTGLQRLRERRHLESLDDAGGESEEGFRPRQIQAWAEDPEELYSQTEMRALVEKTVMKLPAKYRVVLVLRDMEQLSTEEAAAALGLGIPALKARLLRGRLMVREALAPHFTKGAKGVTL